MASLVLVTYGRVYVARNEETEVFAMKVDYKSPLFVFSLISLVFACYLAVLLINIWPIDAKTIAQAGVFGDSFGVLTALFSALAFGGLIITIWQQQEELRQNRDEARVHHFENILFRMLEVHTEIVKSFDIQKGDNGTTITVGRDCFPRWCGELSIRYKKALKDASTDEEALLSAYAEFWSKWNKDLGHYFRFLYNIFKHIDQSHMINKKSYANIVRAQLSDYELLIIFYNCLQVHGKERFKPLCEKYALFDNLPDDLVFLESHKRYYAESAFGSSSCKKGTVDA